MVSAILAIPSNCAALWDDDISIYTDPASPTDQVTFDLEAFRMFPNTGYFSIDQSFSVNGSEINIWALVQEQPPGTVAAQVLWPGGAFFKDFGPLPAGTYHVNVEIWLISWPETSGGDLVGKESLPFLVTSAVPEPATAPMFILALFAICSRRRAGVS